MKETLEAFKKAKKDKVEGLPSETEFVKSKEVEDLAFNEFQKAAS